jgi:hypothetical protein
LSGKNEEKLSGILYTFDVFIFTRGTTRLIMASLDKETLVAPLVGQLAL